MRRDLVVERRDLRRQFGPRKHGNAGACDLVTLAFTGNGSIGRLSRRRQLSPVSRRYIMLVVAVVVAPLAQRHVFLRQAMISVDM